MALNFADLSEVWGDCLKKQKRKNVVKQETACFKKSNQENSMDNIIDTYLDDVYQSQNKVNNQKKTSNKPRCVYMDADIENDQDYYDLNNYHQPIIPKSIKPATTKCKTNIEGVLDRGTENQMDIARYYSNQQMFDYDEYDKTTTTCEAETMPEEARYHVLGEAHEETETEAEAEAREETRSVADEYYNMQPLSMQNMHKKLGRISSEHLYVELALYVFGGIVLIFILEQILQVGIKLSQI